MRSDWSFVPVETAAQLESFVKIYDAVWLPNESSSLDEWAGTSGLYLAAHQSAPVGCLRVYDYDMRFRGGIVRCAGIASVAVLEAHREQGIGAAMMTDIIQICHSDGFDVACLYPYRDTFYRKFDFEMCSARWKIECPRHRFPNLKAELPVRALDANRLFDLKECHTSFTETMNGAVIRTEADWLDRMGIRPPQIFVVGRPIEGYFWIPRDQSLETLIIGEMAWSTPRGYESAMAHARSMMTTQTKLVWTEPTGGRFVRHFHDRDIDISLYRPANYRILNAPRMLESVVNPPPMRLLDPLIESNNFGDGPEIGIRELTQFLLADPALGRPDPPFDALADTRPTFCTEYF
jgi:GNAT superfamily N-acetyltransferase